MTLYDVVAAADDPHRVGGHKTDGCGKMLLAAAACRLRLRRDSMSILEVLRAATARPLPFALKRVVECAVSNPDVWDSLVLYLVLRRDFG